VDIEGYLKYKKDTIESLSKYVKLKSHDLDVFVASFTVLVHSQDSPLVQNTELSLLSKRIDFAFDYLGGRPTELEPITAVAIQGKVEEEIPEDPSRYFLNCLDAFLTKFQYSYEYEHLVTCHIMFMDNCKEMRKPIVMLTDEDKRAKTAETRGKLREQNKQLMIDIIDYTKRIYGENTFLSEKSVKEIRSLNVEDMIK
jgi:hypothetical protein